MQTTFLVVTKLSSSMAPLYRWSETFDFATLFNSEIDAMQAALTGEILAPECGEVSIKPYKHDSAPGFYVELQML
jgi:hypothetical protein